MCEAGLILDEGRWVLSGLPSQLKKKKKHPAQYFVLCNLGEQDLPVLISPDICARLCGEEFNHALRRLCIKKRLWQAHRDWLFFFTLFIKQLLGTHIRHRVIGYILYCKHALVRTLYLHLVVMYVGFSLLATFGSWRAYTA